MFHRGRSGAATKSLGVDRLRWCFLGGYSSLSHQLHASGMFKLTGTDKIKQSGGSEGFLSALKSWVRYLYVSTDLNAERWGEQSRWREAGDNRK